MSEKAAIRFVLLITAANLALTYLMASKLKEAADTVEKPVGTVKKILDYIGL